MTYSTIFLSSKASVEGMGKRLRGGKEKERRGELRQ